MVPLALELGLTCVTDLAIENTGLFRVDIHREDLSSIGINLYMFILLVHKEIHTDTSGKLFYDKAISTHNIRSFAPSFLCGEQIFCWSTRTIRQFFFHPSNR